MNFNEYFKQKQSKFVDIEQLPLTKSVTAFIQFDCICAPEPGWAGWAGWSVERRQEDVRRQRNVTDIPVLHQEVETNGRANNYF